MRTTRGIGSIMTGLLLAACCAVAGTAAAQTPWFAASLAGEREVGSAGDQDGWGLGVVGVEAGTVTYYIWVTDISEPTMAHIHAAPAGQSGTVVIDFAAAFTEVAPNTYAATGRVAAEPGTIAALLDNPAAFYVNVHNADHPAGAVRGQVLGDGPSQRALAGTLRGFRELDGSGDPDGEGFGAVIFDDHSAHYFVAVENVAGPTAAHIHAGTAAQNGPVAIDFEAAFSDGIAAGSVAVDEAVSSAVLARPDGYYFNVHNPEHPGGAARGQLRATESLYIFPVASRIAGQAGSAWRTDLRVLNLSDEDVSVWAEWYPSSAAGMSVPDATVSLGVGGSSTAVVNDSVDTLFGADGNGAMRLLAAEPIVAGSRIFNDQRDNPEIGGTFGQYAPASRPAELLASGALLLGANRPAASGEGLRSNVGYFNPTPAEVAATFSVWSVDGRLLGSNSIDLAPHANEVRGVYQLVPSVPQADRNRDDLVVTFSAAQPIAVYLSVVDNVTNDPVLVSPLPAPAVLRESSGPPANRAPNGTIVQPAGNVTISEGQSAVFEGSATDPDGDAMSYDWDFGDNISSTELQPGPHTYTASGTYTVTFTVTDARGLADPTPDTRTITVEGGGAGATFSQVQSQIFTASCAFSGCHGGSSPAQGMNLTAGSAYSEIVNVPSNQRPTLDRIEPNDPAASYLYLKVTGDPSIAGSRMPLGGPPLSQALIDLLRDWIERGAPND